MGRILAAALLFLTALPATAQAPGRAGDFDFYVLALSWSPSHCISVGQRGDPEQCDRPLGFVVHGLWPEYERGYPNSCPTRQPQPTSAEISSVRDLIPTSALIRHEWRQHGTCAGMAPRAYFDLVRAARFRVSIPTLPVDRSGQASPAAIEAAFTAANPGLNGRGIAVTCEGGRLADVRICLTKGLDFRPCPQVDADACRAPSVRVPAAS